MERITGRAKFFVRALDSLQEAIEKFERCSDSSSSEYRTYRDSLIQRFEYCADIFWKYLNVQLRTKTGVVVDIARPKIVFKESNSAGLLSDDELRVCDNMIEDRNRTSHTYHEELAEEIANKISGYYKLMRTIVQRI